jgi:hypothetical protein
MSQFQKDLETKVNLYAATYSRPMSQNKLVKLILDKWTVSFNKTSDMKAKKKKGKK